MPQFDFFFFWDCIIQFFLVFSLFTVFFYSFLLPLIYKINYMSNLALPSRYNYIECILKFFNLNEKSKNLFIINKLNKIYIIF